MTALKKPKLTPEEYLAIEREAEFKSEYVDGEVFVMSGASINHNRISVNALAAIRTLLKGRPCEVFGSDLKVWLEIADTFAYPDVSGLCGPIDLYDDKNDVYSNPQFIIEVLSDSTETYDRGGKFYKYQSLPTLREYVLISQHEVAVDVYRREGEEWIYRSLRSVDAGMELKSVDVSIPLNEIYDRVEFTGDPKQ